MAVNGQHNASAPPTPSTEGSATVAAIKAGQDAGRIVDNLELLQKAKRSECCRKPKQVKGCGKPKAER